MGGKEGGRGKGMERKEEKNDKTVNDKKENKKVNYTFSSCVLKKIRNSNVLLKQHDPVIVSFLLPAVLMMSFYSSINKWSNMYVFADVAVTEVLSN